MHNDSLFDLTGRVAVLTGAGGILIAAMAKELGRRGAKVVATNRTASKAEAVAEEIRRAGGEAVGLGLDVTDRAGLEAVAAEVTRRYGRIDILVTGAGGNRKEATPAPGQPFFDIPVDALRAVVDLNLFGTVLPCQVFGRAMAAQKSGVIINISSMSGIRPITRVGGYGAAKAAVDNFTQWLAVHLAQTCSPEIRVNAIAPGFFLTEQNRFLLTKEEDGSLTPRGQQVIGHTPMNRFGVPADLLGTLVWLVSPGASFVTGVVVPVDGGFAACSGV